MKDQEPNIKKYEVTPYAARAYILNLEMQYNLTVRVREGAKYSAIFIDKEEKKDDIPILSEEHTASGNL